MEVAYMRVVYCKHSNTNRERHELQATLHTAPQDESPSSSASDVDNDQGVADKAMSVNDIDPLVAGSHVIAARNCQSFVWLLDFTRDVKLAIEASRKRDCLASVKRVVDFSFQHVEELVRLVRLAMEAISCSDGSAKDLSQPCI